MRPDYLARLYQQGSQARMIRFDEQIVADAELLLTIWAASEGQKNSN